MFKTLKLFAVLCLALAFTPKMHAQNQIDPTWQINWNVAAGCTGTNATYIPSTGQCTQVVVNASSGVTQTIVQASSHPLNVNYFAVTGSETVVTETVTNLDATLINGVVQAAQFCGLGTIGGVTTPSCSADACTKLLAANQYAVANNYPMVDASGFIGTVACSANPFNSLNSTIGASVNLAVKFGTTHFQTSTTWLITNSGISLFGSGPQNTRVEYTGTNCTASPTTCAVIRTTTSGGSGTPAANGGPNNVVIKDMSFYGDVGNIYDAVMLSDARSRFDNIVAWGATNCGIHELGVETSTFIHPVVSGTVAYFMGISGSTTPHDGFCLDVDPTFGITTTSETVTDPVMEGVTSSGIHFINANNVTMTGGSSEINGAHGILLDASGTASLQNLINTVIGMDIEGNGNGSNNNGYDIYDSGGQNVYINILSSSPCSATCYNIYLPTPRVGADTVINATFAGTNAIAAPFGAGANGIVNPGYNASGTCTITGGFQYYIRGTQVWVPYCSTEP
jgi:hypothetical protein